MRFLYVIGSLLIAQSAFGAPMRGLPITAPFKKKMAKEQREYLNNESRNLLQKLIVDDPTALTKDLDKLAKERDVITTVSFMTLPSIRHDYVDMEMVEKLAREVYLKRATDIDQPLTMKQLFAAAGKMAETLKASHVSHEHEHDHITTVSTQIFTYDDFLKIKSHYARNPFLSLFKFLHECDCEVGTREIPLRFDIEKKVLAFIQKNMPDKNKQITIADFGSGDLFPIFVMLNQLISQGYKNLRINLLDLEYASIIQRYKANLKPNAQGVYQLADNVDFLSEADKTAFIRLFTRGTAPKADEIEHGFDDLVSLLRDNDVFMQFCQWLQQDDNKIEVIIYADAGDYAADCLERPNRMADIVLGIDIPYEATKAQEDMAFKAFDRLRKNTLKDTGIAFGLAHCGTAAPLAQENEEPTYDDVLILEGTNKRMTYYSVDPQFQWHKTKLSAHPCGKGGLPAGLAAADSTNKQFEESMKSLDESRKWYEEAAKQHEDARKKLEETHESASAVLEMEKLIEEEQKEVKEIEKQQEVAKEHEGDLSDTWLEEWQRKNEEIEREYLGALEGHAATLEESHKRHDEALGRIQKSLEALGQQQAGAASAASAAQK